MAHASRAAHAIPDTVTRVVRQFAIDGEVVAARPYGSGHINQTYLVETRAGPRFVFQKLNTQVFKRPDLLMENVVRVTGHLRKSLENEAAAQSERRVLRLVAARDGASFLREPNGDTWRAYHFIDASN